MANILITGGAGFIGTNFVYYHRKNYPLDNLIIYDALTYAGCKENLDGIITVGNVYEALDYQRDMASLMVSREANGLQTKKPNGYVLFVQGDINDGALLYETINRLSVDTVVHFAAESHVDRSIEGPDAFINTNIHGTYTLLMTALRYQQDSGKELRIHHVSTDEVYGALKPKDKAFSENSPFRPNSPYAASKAASDCIVRSFVTTYGLHITVSNCSNNYGPYQYPEKLLPKTVIRFLCGMRVPIYGSGEQIRDWIYVDDHCQGIELCLRFGRKGETYNIGSNHEVSNIDFVRMVGNSMYDIIREQESQSTIEREAMARRGILRYSQLYPHCFFLNDPYNRTESFIDHVEDRKGHDFRYALSHKKASEELGYEPSHKSSAAFYRSIKQTVRWYLDHPQYWIGRANL